MKNITIFAIAAISVSLTSCEKNWDFDFTMDYSAGGGYSFDLPQSTISYHVMEYRSEKPVPGASIEMFYSLDSVQPTSLVSTNENGIYSQTDYYMLSPMRFETSKTGYWKGIGIDTVYHISSGDSNIIHLVPHATIQYRIVNNAHYSADESPVLFFINSPDTPTRLDADTFSISIPSTDTLFERPAFGFSNNNLEVWISVGGQKTMIQKTTEQLEKGEMMNMEVVIH
jgi:hypothetical protein